jgi:hypothetical protein
MELRIKISGDVVERQELLNGTQTITIEGASNDGWTLAGSVSWNRGLVDYAGEGDMTLSRGVDEVFATLVRSDVEDPVDEAGVDHLMKLQYEVDGGAGAFDGCTGHARADASLAADRFDGTWVITLNP